MQSWEKEIQDRQQAQKDHIEKSIDFSCDKAIENEIEKARSGIYADTYQNRKAGLVGQKYGSEKKMTGDDLDAKYAQASQGKASPQEVAEAHKKFSEQKKEAGPKQSDPSFEIHNSAEKIAKHAGISLKDYQGLHPDTKKELLRNMEKDNKKGSHISDMSNDEKISQAKKMGIESPEKLSSKELDKQLLDKNIEKQMKDFQIKKDLEKFSSEIEEYKKSDPETYREVKFVVDLYKEGKKESAYKASQDLDTFQRELIPLRIYKDMGGTLTKKGEKDIE